MEFLYEHNGEEVYITTNKVDITGKICWKNETWENKGNTLEYVIKSPYINLYSNNSAGQRVYLILCPFDISKSSILLNIQLKIVDNHKDYYFDDNRFRQSVGKAPLETYNIVMTELRFLMCYLDNYNKNLKNGMPVSLSCFGDDKRRFNIYKRKLYQYGFELISRDRTMTLILYNNKFKNINNDKIIEL